MFGITYANLRASERVPSFRLFLRINANGDFIYSLVFLRNIAGMPSGPAAEFFFRFQIAFDMSSSLNIISARSSSSILFISSCVAFIASFVSLN